MYIKRIVSKVICSKHFRPYLKKLIGPEEIAQDVEAFSQYLGELHLVKTFCSKRGKAYSWTALLEEIFLFFPCLVSQVCLLSELLLLHFFVDFPFAFCFSSCR